MSKLDTTAAIISYEEYHPYGTTSYRSGRTETEVSLKRYKYVGKERDEETGLYYYGARYYAAWLCRFVSVDSLQFDYPQLTPFNYAGNKPVTHIDIDGMQSTGAEKQGAQNQTKEQTGVNAYGTVGGLNVGIIDLSHGKSAGYYNFYPCYQKSDDGKYSFSFYMARHNNKDGTYDDVWVVGADAYKDFVKNPTKYQMLERSLKWAMQTGADPNKSQAENLWNAYKSIVFNPMSWVVGASMMVGVFESASTNVKKPTAAKSLTKSSEPKLSPKPEQIVHTLEAPKEIINPKLKIADNKLIQHANQWGISEKGAALTSEQLGVMRNIANDIYENASTIRQGTWGNPEAGGFKNALFYLYGENIVVTQSDGTMITILKNATGNKHFNNARTIWKKK